MGYVLEKILPQEVIDGIFKETQAARQLVSCSFILKDKEFLEILSYENFACYKIAIDYENNNYLINLGNEDGNVDIDNSRYLFYFNKVCYFFCITFPNRNLVKFYAETPYPENIELRGGLESEIKEIFKISGREFTGWNDNDFTTRIYPVIIDELEVN